MPYSFIAKTEHMHEFLADVKQQYVHYEINYFYHNERVLEIRLNLVADYEKSITMRIVIEPDNRNEIINELNRIDDRHGIHKTVAVKAFLEHKQQIYNIVGYIENWKDIKI